MNKNALSCLTAGLLLGSWAAHSADKNSARPFDAKAREIYAHVIGMPTQRGNDLVPAMAEYLAQQFRAAGFPAADITILPYAGVGDNTASLVVRYRGKGKGGKPILLMAHMDVVTAKREDWVRDPYQLTEENGFFYGRGTNDVKQGVTQLTTTFLRLKSEGFVPSRDLIIYFSGDEETAQATTVDVAKNHRELIDAEFALNSDAGGGVLDETTGKPLYMSFQTAEKTYADFAVTVRNPGGHSSQPRADNAIYDLGVALGKLRSYSFPVMWNDTTLAALKAAGQRSSGEFGAALTRFAGDPHDAAAAELIAKNPQYVGQTRTTCVPTMLTGGHAQNALPQSASVNINCRIFPGVKVEDVRLALQNAAGSGVEVKEVGQAMSSDASPLRPDVLKAVTRAVQAVYPGVPVVPAQSSGATDGVVFRSVGIPTYGIDSSFIRPSDDFSHGLNERLPVTTFYNSLQIWYLLLKDMAGKHP